MKTIEGYRQNSKTSWQWHLRKWSRHGYSYLVWMLVLVIMFEFSGLNAYAIATATTEKPTNKQENQLVLQLRWNHQFQFAGYYVADWLGYFKEEGLDVQIRSAFTKDNRILDATQEVVQGRADFGIGAVDILIAENKSAHAQLSVVYSLFQRSAVEFFMKSNTKMNSVVDLVNINTARRKHDLLDIEYQAMLINEGIKPNNTKLIPYNYDFTADDLASGKYDVIPGYLGTIDYLAKKKGIKLKHIKPLDYGIDFYGDSLFVGRKLAEQDPQLVERFRRACIRGWEYALEHPGEIAARISREFRIAGKSENELLSYNTYQAEKVKELTLYPVVQIGNINTYRWEKMQQVLLKLGLVNGSPDFGEFIFNYDKIQKDKAAKSQQLILECLIIGFVLMLIFFFFRLASKNAMLRIENAERRKVEEKIMRSTQRYETMFSSAELGITITSAEGRVLQANRKWLEMTGYEENEVIGRSISEFVIQGDDASVQLRESYARGELASYTLEQQFLRKDGSLFWGRLYLTSIFDQDSDNKVNMGMVLDINNEKIEEETVKRSEQRFRAIINDIATGIPVSTSDIRTKTDLSYEELSEKGQLSLKLERINLELERLFKNEMDENRKKEALLIYQARLAAMGEMIANIAHQWRQPLNMLGLIIANIKDAYEFGELEPKLLDTSVQRSRKLITRMSDTIDDFRFFLNPKNEKAGFSAMESISMVLDLLEENLKFNKIQVVLDNQTSKLAYGYANQYSQAIFNIVSNSIDAIVENGIQNGRLSVRVYDKNDFIVSEISDNGGGITAEHVDKVFDIYFSTKPEEKGTGLGLYMTKLIIENNLNGVVELTGYQDGTTMRVSVPVSFEQQNRKETAQEVNFNEQ